MYVIVVMFVVYVVCILATQVELLASKYHIYMLKNGRVSMCGLNSKNIDYVAAAIKDAVITYPEE